MLKNKTAPSESLSDLEASIRCAPWALRKTDPERMKAVLGTIVAAVRMLAEAIAPVIPASAARLIAMIDAGDGGAPMAQPVALFPRLELEAAEETGEGAAE